MHKIIRGGESHWMEKTFVDEEIAVRFIRFKTKYFLIPGNTNYKVSVEKIEYGHRKEMAGIHV